MKMTEAPADKSLKRSALIHGSMFHIFHDGIADGMAVFLPLWQTSFGLALTQVGLLVSCFEGATGFCQIPAGFLGERFGERPLLVLGTLITALSFAAIGFATGPISLVLLLLIGGIGAAVQHPLAAAMVSQAYQAGSRRTALGIYNFSGDVGKFLFPALTAVAFLRFGWRWVCTALGIFGCLLTLMLFIGFRISAVRDPQDRRKPRPAPATGWGILNPGAFFILSAIGIVDTAVRIGLTAFGPFLFIQKGIAPERVGFALSLLFIGGAIGKFVCGALAARIGIIAAIVITEGLTGAGILSLTFLPLPWIYLCLPLLGMALNGTSSVLYGTVADFVSPDRLARAFSLFYTFVIAAAAIAPPLVGWGSDMLGVTGSIRLIGWIALGTLPLAGALSRQMKPSSY